MFDKEKVLNAISEATKLPAWKLRNIYVFGSTVYGNNTELSDVDFCVVGSNLLPHQEWKVPSVDLGSKVAPINIHVYTNDVFAEMVRTLHIIAIECILAPDEFKIKEDQKFEIDTSNKSVVASAILSTSSNCWGKSKYKMNDGDLIRGVKSAYHSLRILDFGIQILKHGKIKDFSAGSKWRKKLDGCLSWRDIKKKAIHPRLAKLSEIEEIVGLYVARLV